MRAEADCPGYDLLIMGYDFDPSFINGALKIKLVNPKKQFYTFSYVNVNVSLIIYFLDIHVGKTDKGYRIEKLRLSDRRELAFVE